ncbi:MAG: dockerin type I repeat-containing protein [Prevotella sp.]|nr:dockerin type I repeat-containing protein [Prevotella sp.]
MKKPNHLFSASARVLLLTILCGLYCGLPLTAADIPTDGIWTMQEPEGLEFTTFTDDGTRYYLYNPATKMFFSSGNGWNTQASLRTFGMEIWLQEATEYDAPEGSYELWDNNANNSARYTGENNMFTDVNDGTWVDHGTQDNYSWAYEIVGDCVRFQNVSLIADKPEFTGMYLGFDGTYVTVDNNAYDGKHLDAFTAILRHVAPAAPGASVDWKAVTVESYEAFVASDSYQAYADGAKQYIASIGLKLAIEEAEKVYVDVTAAMAIYTNTASTPDQMITATNNLNKFIDAKKKLQTAIENFESSGFTATGDAKAVLTNTQATLEEIGQAHKDLNAALIEWSKSHASVENPVNMTTLIVNYSFDNGDCTTGWSGTAFGRNGKASDGAEHFDKNYDTYQTISGLAPGVYAVGMNGYYRAGNHGGDAEYHWLANDEESRAAKLYGVVGDNYFETPIVNVFSGAQPEYYNVGDVAVSYTDENGDPVTVYVPYSMAAGDYYMHNLHQYANKLYVTVDETGELTIGVKKTTYISEDWSMFDDFSLTYYGVDPDEQELLLSQIANTVYMNNVKTCKGTQAEIAIQMKNTADIRGFQFNLYLPDGVTVKKHTNGKYMATLCQERLDDGDSHTLNVTMQEDGALLFLCSSLSDETFLGNDGDIISLTVEVSEDMADGDHTVTLKNIKLSETDISQHYDTAELQSVLTVVSYVIGDISGDGVVDVSDYIGIANCIMGNPPADFNADAADVNGDGVIDVSDYIGVANIILYGNIYGK